MIINWFSPLPPAKTDIANYTLRIVYDLHKKIDINLWTNQQEWSQELEKYATVKQYQLDKIPWFELNQGDMNIYNLGNNATFHGDIWKISRQSPGLVILHDNKLQDFFYMLYPDKNDYIQQMKNIYGEKGGKIARLFLNGYYSLEFITENYPLTSLALENALGVITHNREVYLSLQEKNQWLTAYTPLPYISDELKSDINQKTAKIPYKLIIFGFIAKNRRLDTILKALSEFKQKDSFQLNIYGELWDENYIIKQVEELGLENIVTIHGFVTDNELDTALRHSDLAINLRYPTMGEASGSQLRIWNHSLPSLVTKIDWYGSLNPEAVAFVRHNHEIEDIQQHLQNFLDNPHDYQKMGIKGKQILENDHHPNLYTQAIIDVVKQVYDYRQHSAIDRIIQCVARELNYLNPNIASNSNLTNISEAIKFITE
jgi:glycosyltransferase involved in cell wall biosynthesis